MLYRRVLAAASLASLVASNSAAQPAQGQPPGNPTLTPVSQTSVFTDDDLLIFEVTSDHVQLTDGLSAYSSRAGIYFPVGELSRLLDLAITVDPATQRAEGWFLSENRTFLLDLKKHHARVDGRDYDLSDTDAVLFHDDIYLRGDLWEKFLPLALKASKSDLTVEIVTRERFPFEERLERERRRSGLGGGARVAEEAVIHFPTHYDLFTPPAADLTEGINGSNHTPKFADNWELRLGGDLLYAGAQLFVGSDNSGNPNSARAMLERKDPDGLEAGFFGATRSDAGDVNSPSLALGAVSQEGRGATTTSVPLDQATVFSTTDVRGQLPAGYEVELYVNEILRGSQAQSDRGEYAFLSVPLTYGLNVIRLVFYGPRGERREEVRRVNVGSGQLHAGQFQYSLGAMQQQTPLIRLSNKKVQANNSFGMGSARIVGSVAYGLDDDWTVTGGFAQYLPNASFDHRVRRELTGGLLTSLAGFAVELDGAGDDHGGSAAAVGVGGKLFDVSILTHHTEYFHGFIDEVQFRDLTASTPVRRASDATLDWSLPIPFSELSVPLSVHGQRSEYVDGTTRLFGEGHLSTAIGSYIFSAGWQYQDTSQLAGPATVTSTGTFSASALVWQRWQIRAETDFDSVQGFRIQGAGLELDGTIGDRNTVRLSALHTFVTGPSSAITCTTASSSGGAGGSQGSGSQTTILGGCAPPSGTTAVTFSTTWHFSNFDLSGSAGYVPESHALTLGVQVALGALFDPMEGRYVPVSPGAAAGGTAILDAFVDTDGNGVREPGETAVAGLSASAGGLAATTDSNGEAVVLGLGDVPHAVIHVNQESISDPYLSTPADAIDIVPHPGRVTVVPYPLRPLGEVALKMLFTREGEAPRGLSALDLQLVAKDGKVVGEGRTEYDGTIVIERVPAGTFAVRIDPEQARRLKLALSDELTVTMPSGGGYVGEITGHVVLSK